MFCCNFFISRKQYLIGEVLKHIFFRNPGIAKVERDVKSTEGAFVRINTACLQILLLAI